MGEGKEWQMKGCRKGLRGGWLGERVGGEGEGDRRGKIGGQEEKET